MLRQIVAEKWISANAVIGFWPANSVGDDDIRLYSDETPQNAARDAPHAAPADQPAGSGNRANTALADFIAPEGSGVADYIGGFAVTAGIGEEVIAARFERANDDYSKIMVKALADRLAEAFAEHMHERVRREFWAYARTKRLVREELIKRAISRHPPGAGLSRAA